MHVNIHVTYFSLGTEHLEACMILALFGERKWISCRPLLLHLWVKWAFFPLHLTFDFIPLTFAVLQCINCC